MLRCLAATLLGFAASVVQADVDEILCDPRGVCLSTTDSVRYRQAEAQMQAGDWFAASQILGELYVRELHGEEDGNLLVANNYAVALARSGHPAVAALVLEKYFGQLNTVGPGFENLMQTYEHLAVPADAGRPPIELTLLKALPSPPDLRPLADSARVAATVIPASPVAVNPEPPRALAKPVDTDAGDQMPALFSEPLNEADLAGKSARELKLMRNEIFARRGFMFQPGGAMDTYFRQQPWYQPRYSDVGDQLTEVQGANILLLRRLERAQR